MRRVFGNKKSRAFLLILIGLTIGYFWPQSQNYFWDTPGVYNSILERSILDMETTEKVWRSWAFQFQQALEENQTRKIQDLISQNSPVRLSSEKRGGEVYEETLWRATSGPQSVGIVDYLLSFEKVRYSQFFFRDQFISEEDRGRDMEPTAFAVQGDFQIVGRDKASGGARVDRGYIRLKFEHSLGGWKLKEFLPYEIQSLVKTRASSFEDSTETWVGDNQHLSLRREAIRRGGYAIAVGDVNGDTWPDLFLGHSDRSEMLINQNGRGFKKMEADFLGIGKVKAAAFADFNNRGRQDLVMTTFNPKEGGNNVLLLKGNGSGEFEEMRNSIHFRNPANYPMPLAVGNFNKDRWLDFYVGYPGSQDFTFMSHQIRFERNLISHGIYQNEGEHQFKDISGRFKEMNFHRRDMIFPHSAIAFDLTRNGLSDLLVIDDRDNLSPFYLADEEIGFVLSSEKTGIQNTNYAMGAAVGDLNNDGHFDIVVSYVNFHAADRHESLLSKSWSEKVNTGFSGKGLVIYLNDGRNRFVDVTSSALKYSIGEGVGNVEVFDFDNDGLLDIYVTNGLWTGYGREDVSGRFIAENIRGTSKGKAWNLKDRTSSKSQSDFMDALVKNKDHSFAGNQRNVLLRNNGDMTFTDVAPLEGVDSSADGYVVALADVNRDGRQDLLLRNGDPAHVTPGYKAFQLFLNKRVEDRSVRLLLTGVSASRDAIGTHVKLHSGERIQSRQVIANNGAAQSERVVHFGLGEAALADRLEIWWPQGQKQEFHDILPGTYSLTEGGQLHCDSCLKISERGR